MHPHSAVLVLLEGEERIALVQFISNVSNIREREDLKMTRTLLICFSKSIVNESASRNSSCNLVRDIVVVCVWSKDFGPK